VAALPGVGAKYSSSLVHHYEKGSTLELKEWIPLVI